MHLSFDMTLYFLFQPSILVVGGGGGKSVRESAFGIGINAIGQLAVYGS